MGSYDNQKSQEFDGIYEVLTHTSIKEILNDEYIVIYDDSNSTLTKILAPNSIIAISCKRGNMNSLINSLGQFHQFFSQISEARDSNVTYIGLLKYNEDLLNTPYFKTNNSKLNNSVILMIKLP
jgi:hypothetical protein